MSTDGEQATPLAIATERPTSDDEDPAPKPHKRRRRRCLICGASCAAVLVVLAVLAVVLALTVFKVKEPVMTMNSVTVQRLDFTSGALSAAQPLAVNMTVVADVSVKNPNAASVRFGASTTALYYRARQVGVARGPPGTAWAHRTFRLNVTVDVTADGAVFGDANLFEDLATGSITVTTSTAVGGRVRILGLFKHHVDVMMNCSITMAVENQSIMDQNCRQKVWL